MIDLIRRALTRKSRIRDLVLERDELIKHLARLEDEMKGIFGHLSRITQERRVHSRESISIGSFYEHHQFDPKSSNLNFNYFQPGHYYSPIPSIEEVKKDEERIFSNPKTLPGVDLNIEGQIALLDRIRALL